MVLRFPGPAQRGASRWQILRGSLTERIGRVLRKLRIPGAMSEADILDDATGQSVRVRVGSLFTRISVNGRDYYFDRFTGRYDGTGTGCR